MSRKVKAIILTGNGTNCEMEMAHACKMAGADTADIVHLSELLYGEKRLEDYTFLNLPGGFLDGDDMGSAKAGANRFLCADVRESRELLFDQLLKFIRDGKLILGVCNGFQLMIKLGLLPALGNQYANQSATLTYNDSGRFEDRWVYLKANPQSPCVYTRGANIMYLPVRHGEGKFIPQNAAVLGKIGKKNLYALQYCDSRGLPSMTYPDNPDEGQGLFIFRNAVNFIRSKEF